MSYTQHRRAVRRRGHRALRRPGRADSGRAAHSRVARQGSAPSRAARCRWSASPTSSKLRVYVYVPEDGDQPHHAWACPRRCTLREFPGREFTGTVARFAQRARSVDAHHADRGRSRQPGPRALSGHVRRRHRSSSSAIPTRCSSRRPRSGTDGQRALRLRRAQTASWQSVPVTHRASATADRVEIASGLNGDEQVVTNLSPALTRGREGPARSSRRPTAAAAATRRLSDAQCACMPLPPVARRLPVCALVAIRARPPTTSRSNRATKLTLERAIELALAVPPRAPGRRSPRRARPTSASAKRVAHLLPQVFGVAQYLRATDNGIGDTAYLAVLGITRAPEQRPQREPAPPTPSTTT